MNSELRVYVSSLTDDLVFMSSKLSASFCDWRRGGLLDSLMSKWFTLSSWKEFFLCFNLGETSGDELVNLSFPSLNLSEKLSSRDVDLSRGARSSWVGKVSESDFSYFDGGDPDFELLTIFSEVAASILSTCYFS